MSQAEALLATLAEHTHPVVDDDSCFVIDVETRTITSDIRRHYLMQRDHNSTRFTFELPRFVEGHDMSLCNQAKIHYNNIDEDGNENADVCDADDLHLDGDKLVCSWLISRNATQLAGSLNFLIQYQCIVDGVPVYEWHTDIYGEVVVKPGRSNSEQAVVEYTDILEQWRARLFGAGDSVIADVAAAGEAQKEAIAARAEVVLGTIPEEYNTTYNMANSALRTRANAIVAEAEGETILLNDASDDYIRGLKIFGKTTQDGTPTPDAPVELVSIENPVVTSTKKNLCACQEYAVMFPCRLKKGVAYTVSVDNEASDAMCLLFYNKNRDRFHSVKCVEEGVARRYASFTPTDDVYYAQWAWAVVETVENGQIEIGEEATSYEPYAGSDVSMTHTLHGIPVTSGGNYTDENGQQWIADYVDFERGVYVQRVKKFIISELDRDTWRTWGVNANSEGITGFYHYFTYSVILDFVLCNIGVFGATTWGGLKTGVGASADSKYVTLSVNNDLLSDVSSDEKAIESLLTLIDDTNATMLAAIEPIETPLTEEELFAFSQLHSNYPTTTILNDSGAHMAVRYNADTQTYFNNSRGASDEQVANAVNAWMEAGGAEDIVIPDHLPNEFSLTFTGAVSATYNGSKAVSVKIPTAVPAVTSADNGAFLRVVDGAWAKATIPNAEEASF